VVVFAWTDNNNIYFAKRQVYQKGKSPPKLATILRATKKERKKRKKLHYKHLDKPSVQWVAMYILIISLLEQSSMNYVCFVMALSWHRATVFGLHEERVGNKCIELAARCCHLANNLTNLASDWRTDRRTERHRRCVKTRIWAQLNRPWRIGLHCVDPLNTLCKI